MARLLRREGVRRSSPRIFGAVGDYDPKLKTAPALLLIKLVVRMHLERDVGRQRSDPELLDQVEQRVVV